jgi:hypothetical protein
VLNAIPNTGGSVSASNLAASGTGSSSNFLRGDMAWTSATGTGAVALASLPTFTTTIGVGGATASASGSGISFPATQSASSDANTLDDYEEGTWTPTMTSQSGSITSYSTTNGTYTKIGNTVSINVFINMTNAGTAGGTLTLTLPIAPANVNWAGFGGEIQAVGFCLNIFGTGSALGFRKYENSTAVGTGNGFNIGAVYRSA